MTEPSKEAAEALAQVMYAEPGNDPERKIAIAGLAAALPIERTRWEQEVRERLLELADKFEAAAGPNGPKQCQCCRKANKQLLDLAAAFGEAERIGPSMLGYPTNG